MVNGLLSLSKALLEECDGLTLVVGATCVQFESVRSWLLARGVKRSELPTNCLDKHRCYDESQCVFVTPLALVGDLLRGVVPAASRALILRPNVEDQALIFAGRLLEEKSVDLSFYFDEAERRGEMTVVEMTEEMMCAEQCLNFLLDACSNSLFKKGKLPCRPKAFRHDPAELCAMIDSLETPTARRDARFVLREDLKDIVMLRRLLRRLYSDDSLAFYLRLLGLQRDENHRPRNWMISEHFDRLVTVAKKRLFDSSAPYQGLKIEDPPKRAYVLGALRKLRGRRRTVIVVRDDLSAQQVVDWLAVDAGAVAAKRVAESLFGVEEDASSVATTPTAKTEFAKAVC